ncbi:MAG: hypothetical protein NXI12_04180 [Alphaproteobacteria bacterium]|nr:hypothetical protein [Alphaproteobacteria bacterium]
MFLSNTLSFAFISACLVAAGLADIKHDEQPAADLPFYCANIDVDYCGPITRDFEEAASSPAALADGYLTFTSSGGDARIASLLALQWRWLGGDARVVRLCGSSCLEVLLPTFKSVAFIDEPVVLSHGSPHMLRTIYERHAPSAAEQCRPIAEHNRFATLLSNGPWAHVSDRIGMVQLDRLGVENIQADDVDGCIRLSYDQEVDHWLPTTDELRLYYGLSTSGTVAADNLTLAHEKVSCLFPPGETFRVGDAVITADPKVCPHATLYPQGGLDY